MTTFNGGGAWIYREAISGSIDYNNGTIIRAKMTVTATGDGTVRYWLTADGSNWEEVTSGVTHAFKNTGTDLRWKITGSGKTITEIKIEGYH